MQIKSFLEQFTAMMPREGFVSFDTVLAAVERIFGVARASVEARLNVLQRRHINLVHTLRQHNITAVANDQDEWMVDCNNDQAQWYDKFNMPESMRQYIIGNEKLRVSMYESIRKLLDEKCSASYAAEPDDVKQRYLRDDAERMGVDMAKEPDVTVYRFNGGVAFGIDVSPDLMHNLVDAFVNDTQVPGAKAKHDAVMMEDIVADLCFHNPPETLMIDRIEDGGANLVPVKYVREDIATQRFNDALRMFGVNAPPLKLMGQWLADGIANAFPVRLNNGDTALFIPTNEDGGVYVTREQAAEVFLAGGTATYPTVKYLRFPTQRGELTYVRMDDNEFIPELWRRDDAGEVTVTRRALSDYPDWAQPTLKKLHKPVKWKLKADAGPWASSGNVTIEDLLKMGWTYETLHAHGYIEQDLNDAPPT